MMPADEYTVIENPLTGAWHIVAHYGIVTRVLRPPYDTRDLAMIAALELGALDDVARLSGPQPIISGG